MKRIVRGLITAFAGLIMIGLVPASSATLALAAPPNSNHLVVLNTPVLVSPADGSTTSDGTPDFDWDIVPFADHYQIQVDNSLDFSSPEININVTATFTGYTPASYLAIGTYYWRVQAMNLSGDLSAWSLPWTLTIGDGDRFDIDLNTGWRFHLGDVAGAQGVGFNDSAWTLLDVPHTWNNLDGQDGGNNYIRGIGWYRKHYTIPSEYAARQIFVRFEAVSKVADVYVNGTLVGRHEGAFAAFAFDISNLVVFGGDNVIAVKANNSASMAFAPLSGDFNQDGGIFRPVHLLVTSKVHVTPLDFGSPGVYLTPSNVSAISADLQVAAKVVNRGTTQEAVTVHTSINDANGMEVATLTTTQTMPAGGSFTFNQNTTISNPHLWNGRSDPYLYEAVIKIKVGDIIVDQIVQPLGFRYFHLDPNTGITLNGQPLDLHGVAMHEGRRDKGRAISDADRAEDFDLIMEMGATFVRLAHYQHAETVYDLADENGLILWTEIPLVNSALTSTTFTDNAKQQLRELIRQNYNHPSIFFWGLYNEINISASNVTLVTALNTLAHAEDSTRLTTGANLNSIPATVTLPMDTVAWNLYYGWYSGTLSNVAPALNNIHVNHPYLGVSEYGAGGSINHHEENPAPSVPVSPWHPEEYQNAFHESYWKQMVTLPFLWTKTIWVAFDFAVDSRNEGDTPGRNDKGMITFDRSVKKDSFFWYKANWSDEPVVYITSRRFVQRDNNVVEVKVYSNCDSVEMFVDDVSHGTLTSTDHSYRWTGVHLGSGQNTVSAVCTLGAEQYHDEVIWDTGPVLSPLPPGLHQEADSRIVYIGSWNTLGGGAPYITNQRNAVAKFDFRGTELRLYRTIGNNYGAMQVCVDGVCQTVNNFNATTQTYQMATVASGLPNGVHRVVIRNLSTSFIDLDAVEVIGPPDVPTLVSPTDGSTTADNTPDFDWADAAGATQYQVQIDNNTDFSSPEIDTTTAASGYTPAIALPNGTYSWRVRAGNGLWSEYSSVWSVTVALVPAIPTLIAPADGLTVISNTPEFDWEYSGSGAYHIQISDDPNFTTLVLGAKTVPSSYTPEEPLPNGTYYWHVRVLNGALNPFSETWMVVIGGLPEAPSDLTAVPISQTRIDLSWVDNAPDEDGFIIQRSPAGVETWLTIATPGTDATTYSDTTVTCGRTYDYRVIASNAGGDSAPSNTASAKAASCGIPKPPKITQPATTIVTNDDTLEFAWTPVANVISYRIQISQNATFTQIAQESLVDETATFTASHLDDGGYYVRVQGINAEDIPGKWSATRKIAIDTMAPAVPLLKKPADGVLLNGISPTLVVMKSPGAIRYRFQLATDESFANVLLTIFRKAAFFKVSASLGLAHGETYFWRVAAVDKAGNVSGWSAVRSFSIAL